MRSATPSDWPVVRSFSGGDLLQIAMPMGGIGAGCICLNGHGGLQDFSIRNRPATTALPDGHGFQEAAFGLLRVVRGGESVTRLLEGPLPVEKIYDQGLQAQGYRKGGHEGLPRFRECSFDAGYPFGRVRLGDPSIPLRVEVVGWSPLIPLDDHHSSLPCAILEYTFANNGSQTIDIEFSYHLSHLAPGQKNPNARSHRLADLGVLFNNTEDPHHETHGSGALVAVGYRPKIKGTWARGGWFDWTSALWREVSTGTFQENDGTGPDGQPSASRNGGSVLVAASLEPGQAVRIPVVITWHYPNSNQEVGAPPAPQPETGVTVGAGACDPATGCCDPGAPAPKWRPYYAGYFHDAGEVAAYVAQHLESLRERTLAFARALLGSTLPREVIDAVSSNLAILKSSTVLRQENGNVWAWEGCFTGSGCCHGSCTHVWNYAQAMPHLFPKLERTLREQELKRSLDERGHANFRAALPDGPTGHGYHAAADGQLGGILKLCRDWRIGGDTTWMRSLYPLAKRSLEYCIQQWDPEERGGLFEPHHNTYDIEFWGPDGMCTSIYAGALSAMAVMAEALGQAQDVQRYRTLAERTGAFIDSELFNGEYHQQKVMWDELRDRSFANVLAKGDAPPEVLSILRAEGPKYQYGDGCLSDGVIGAWMAIEYGIDTPMSREKVRATLAAIFRHNFRDDLFEHVCTQRPGYAVGHEPGLLLCSWPRGGKPTLPFVYSDEVWTGIEYQVASHLIHEGMVDEGLTVVRAARSRYEGHVRNPFNEYECGNYYARALASYAVLNALSGFRYNAVDRSLIIAPKAADRPLTCFFSTASAFGTFRLDGAQLTIKVVEGSLAVDWLQVGDAAAIHVNATTTPARPLEVALAS